MMKRDGIDCDGVARVEGGLLDLTRCLVIIPALNPSTILLDTVTALRRLGLTEIVVVDDGSDQAARSIFEQLRSTGTEVLRHVSNRGKGAALKTGFRHALTRGYSAVVTADADGQHAPVDIVRVAEHLLSLPDTACVLGVRSFRGSVPFRSRFGNQLTRGLFRSLSTLSVTDTQTGLRGLSCRVLPELMAIESDRYEFEMEMLMWLARHRVPVRELPIETIYIDHNANSHFHPLLDSLRIYWVLFRDLFVATSSFGIDIALFSLLFSATESVMLSTYAARFISGTYNFLANRHFVFKTSGNRRILSEAIQYLSLAFAIASVSGWLVNRLYGVTAIDVTVCKIAVDVSLYGVSFLFRRYLIFAKQNS